MFPIVFLWFVGRRWVESSGITFGNTLPSQIKIDKSTGTNEGFPLFSRSSNSEFSDIKPFLEPSTSLERSSKSCEAILYKFNDKDTNLAETVLQNFPVRKIRSVHGLDLRHKPAANSFNRTKWRDIVRKGLIRKSSITSKSNNVTNGNSSVNADKEPNGIVMEETIFNNRSDNGSRPMDDFNTEMNDSCISGIAPKEENSKVLATSKFKSDGYSTMTVKDSTKLPLDDTKDNEITLHEEAVVYLINDCEDCDQEEEERLERLLVLLKEVRQILAEIRRIVLILETSVLTFWQEKTELENSLQAQNVVISNLKRRLAGL